MMNFGQAIRTCFSKYFVFSGRASRAEFWYFYLFDCLVCLAIYLVLNNKLGYAISGLFNLIICIPMIAVAARRLHDVNKTALWLFLFFVPVIGWIVLLIWFILPGTNGFNQYGPPPYAMPQPSPININKF